VASVPSGLIVKMTERPLVLRTNPIGEAGGS
jgi:hypothetical protein